MFIAALFTIAKIWKPPKCPSADEWIRKRCCVCTHRDTHTHTHAYIYTQYVHTETYTHTHIHIHTICTHRDTHTHTHTYTHNMYTQRHTHTRTRTYTHNMYTQRHTHTHTHTYTHNGILLSPKKEWNIVICSNMDAPRHDHTKWSKSDKDKCHMRSLIYRILKNNTNELIYKTEMDSQT